MTIDEILAKYQKALTKKQIEDLIQKSEQYKLLNAGNRANAQTQLAKQYRQTRRGLQNMGLAGREGKLLSGREIGVNDAYRNAYGTYNQQLQQAEGAMLEQDAARKAASTARARAAAAQKAAEEAKAKAEAQLAEQQQMQNNEKWDAMHPGSQWSRNPQLYTKDEQDALWNYDPFKHTANENVNYYHQVAEQNGMKGVEANRYAMSMAADVENRKGAAAEAIQPHGLKPNQEQIQKNLPSLRFAQDYGVNLMKLKQEDPAMAQTIEDDVKYWYDFIDEKSEFWNNAIRNKTKDYHAALQMQANSYAALAKLSLAAKAPAEQRKYYLMSDAEFNTAYDATERAYTRAEQEYQIAKKDSSSTMDDVISEPKAALEKAMRMKTLMDQIKKDRASNSTVNLLAYQMPISDSMKIKDKEYATTREYVDENQIGRITVNGKNGDQSFNGRETNPSSNWSSIRNLGWSADDYAKRHDTKGSKYAALINEWSLINGRTAALYGPGQLDNLDPDAIGGTLDFIQMLFGANRADTDVNYKWFRDQCLMALRGNYDDTGSVAQKEQMDAMLTLANLMTNEERARFNALLDTMGANAADEYFDLLYKNVLPERFTAYVSDYNADYMDELPWAAKAAFSVESVLPSLTQGIPGIAHAYSTNQQDPAAARVSATGYNQAQNIRNARMQKFGKFGQFAYGTTMSMWDSYFSAAISSGIGNALEGVGVGAKLAGKIGSTIGGSLLGASAYNSTYQEGLERGLTPEKARMTALGAGINEMLFESLSLDLVVGHYQKGGMLKVSKNAFVNWIVNTLVQGGVEGSEEVFTDIGNNLWDKMVNGIYSEELTKIREYVSQGMTLEEAKRKVSGEFAAQLGMSFAGGFASGGVMGGGSTFLGMVQNRGNEKIGKGLRQNSRVMNELRNFDFKSEYAQEILQQKNLTNADIADLFNIMQQELLGRYKSDIQKAVADGKITQEQADLLKQYEQNGVQIVKDGDVIANENGITAEQMPTVQDAIANLDNAARIQFLNNEETRSLVQAVGGETAAVIEQSETADREAERAYRQTIAEIDSDTTLTDEQKAERKEEAKRTRQNARSEAEKIADTALTNKKGIGAKLETDGNGTVKVGKGSGKVTYDFSTKDNPGHQTVDSMTATEQSALRIAKIVAASRGDVNVKVEAEFGVDENGIDHSNENGYYNKKTNTIHINMSGDNSVLWTLSHELTHHLANTDTEAYAALRTAIETALKDSKLKTTELEDRGFEYDLDRVDPYIAREGNLWDALVAFEREEHGYDKDAEEEVVARCCESFLGFDQFVKDFARKQYKSAKAINKFIAQMNIDMQRVSEEARQSAAQRNVWNDESPENQILRQLTEIDRIANLWRIAVNAEAKKRQAAREETRASTKDSVQMENRINKLREEIASIENDSERLFTNGREFDNARLKKLKNELNALIEQERKASVKTSLSDILANLDLYRRSDLISMAGQLTQAWDDVDEMTTQELRDGIREIIEEREYTPLELQAKSRGLWVRPATIASTKDSVKRSDAEYLDLARRYESGDKSVEAELRKQVDAAAKRAGYSIKAFHGTTENFNVFSRKQQGANHKGYLEFGAGFYFTPSETEAEQWVKRGRSGQDGKAPNVMSVYLNPMRMLSADESVPGGAKYLRTWLSQGEAEFIAARTYRFINYLIEDKGFSNVEAQETLKALGYDAIEATFKNGTEGQYVVFDPSQIKSADLITKDDNGNIIPLSERFNTENEDIRFSMKDNVERKYTPETTMTMQQAKRMLEMTFNANGFRGYKGYKTADEWLQSEGAAEVAWYAENTETVVDQYFNRFPELTDYEVTIEEVLEAYQKGTLVGKEKTAKETIDLKTGNGYKDSRFYAPKLGSVTEETIKTANLRVTSTNRDKVYAARRDVLFAAHTEEGIATLGLTQKELNKRLQNWSRYSERARTLSMKLNQGVAEEYWWTGLQNSSILSTINVTDQDIRSLVKDIIGTSSEYQRNYIGRTMLALDTHIDWSELTFEFTRTSNAKEGARGYYDDNNRHIAVGSSGYLNTVAHEMGHALDYKWGRDLFTKMSVPITQQHASNESKIASEEGRKFYHHFAEFSQKVEDACDIRSSYTQRGTEAFARFVARFVEWTANTAGSQSNYEAQYYNDRFTTGLYLEFVQILQEKARLDSMARNETRASKMDKVRLSTVEGESLGKDYLKYLQLGTKVVNQTATEEEIRDFKQRMNELSDDNRMAFLDRLREKLIRDDEGAKVREVRDRQIAALKEELKQARERRAADREARKRDDIKRNIQKGSAKITQMLVHPTEQRHVPVQFAQEVIEFMTMLNDFMNATVKEDATEPMTKRGKAIAEKLKQVYDESFIDKDTIEKARKENLDYNPLDKINGAFKDVMLSDMISVVGDVLADKRVDTLTTDELTLINNVVRGVTRTILDANKMTQSKIKHDANEAGVKAIHEILSQKKMNPVLRTYLEETLDLRRLMLIFNGSNQDAVFVQLADELNQGAIETERVAQVLQNVFKPVTDQYGKEIRKWYGKNAEWIDTGVKYKLQNIRMTKGMRVSLAMHVLNEGNMKHIKNGGLVIPDATLYKKGAKKDSYAGDGRQHVRLDVDTINEILKGMTDAEKAYLEVAKDFFHNRTGYYINKTSLATVGYRKAMVKNYFPIHTDDMFNIKDLAQYFMDNGGVETQGFLKERKSGGNPILLEDITDVINRQINGVSLYAGLAAPVRNWNAVMNAQEWVKETEKGDDGNKREVWRRSDSVERVLTSRMGENGVKVLKQFLADVQRTNHADVTFFDKFVNRIQRNYVQAVLLGNIKVAWKQLASIPTAAYVIPWKYLAKAMSPTNLAKKNWVDIDVLHDRAPLYAVRETGRATEIANLAREEGIDMKYPKLFGWMTMMDTWAVRRLWSAAEYMVRDQRKDIPVGSDEYYKVVNEIWQKTVQQTQPNFTPLQRADALRLTRGKYSALARPLVMFGTQRMQNGGILIEATAELINSKGKSKEVQREARLKFGRAVASQVVQNVMLILISGLADYVRGRMRALQDDDDEITDESVSRYIIDQFLSNGFGSFLGGSEVYEILIKKWVANSSYDKEFSVPFIDALETIAQFADKQLPDALKYFMSGERTDEEKLKKAKSFGMQMAKVFGYATGIPVENLVKDILNGAIPRAKDHIAWRKTGELIPFLHQSGKLDKKTTNANYKEWTSNGFKGSEYFYWENVLSAYGKREEKIPILLDADLPNEKKAMLLRMMDKSGATSEGTVVYKSNGDVLIDFANPTEKQQALPMPTAETEETAAPTATPTATPKPTENPLTDARQEGVREAVAKGVPEQTAFDAFLAYQNMGKNKNDDYSRNDDFRAWLFANVTSPEQRAILEYQVIGTAKKVEGSVTYRDSGVVYRDYTNEAWFKLSQHNLAKDGTNKRYDAGKKLEKTGLSVDKTVAIYDGLADYTKKAEWTKYLKDQGLTEEQITIFLWSRGWAKLG